jgi:hypothetical protein
MRGGSPRGRPWWDQRTLALAPSCVGERAPPQGGASTPSPHLSTPAPTGGTSLSRKIYSRKHVSYTGLMISRRITLFEPVFTNIDII